MDSKFAIKKELFDSSLRILVAEDNDINQKIMLKILEKMGYNADLVVNGLEAIDALYKKKYDIIFMDVRMPKMNGLEATQEIRKIWKDNDQLAIIAMTAYAMVGDRERCLEAGMDDYITKPINIDMFKNLLIKWGKQVKASQFSAVGSGFSNKNNKENGILNTEMIDSIFAIDGGDFIIKIFNKFTNQFPSKVRNFKDYVKNEDFENLGFVSHEIKGSGANIGAKSLSEICYKIEKKAKAKDKSNLIEDIDSLVKMFNSTKIEFDKYISKKRRM